MKRAGVKGLAAIIGVAALLIAAALVANLPAFDEPLLAELEQLKATRAPREGSNSYPLMLGFLSGAEQREQWPARFESLDCVARVELDCADRLIAEVASADMSDPRLAVLFQRFEALAEQQFFDAGQAGGTPSPPYGAIRNVSRLSLAAGISKDSSAGFIARVARHHRLWRQMLRDGDTLAVKMTAIAGIQDTLDFMSALMRSRDLSDAEVGLLQAAVTPMTPEESDIGAAFLAEARAQVLGEDLPLASDASLLERALLQRNATLNEFYRSWIQPMRQRARPSARELLQAGGNQPLEHPRRASIYNWGGSRLVATMQWDPEQFIARTHDQGGRILLVLLQAELEGAPEAVVGQVLADSSHRNPYTGEPMQHSELSGTIGFPCMHTAYHPPAKPDNCAVRIRGRGNLMAAEGHPGVTWRREP